MKTWLLRRIGLIFALVLLALLVIITLFADVSSDIAIRLAVISTFFAAISSVTALLQATESQRQRESTERPEVAVYLKPANRLMYCIIQNLGNLPARNIRIDFSPSPVMHDGKLLQELSLFAKPIPYLPPNEKYWRHLGASPDVLRDNSKPFEIAVYYESSTGKSYNDKFVIDLSVLAEANDPELSTPSQLAVMSARLDAFVKALEKERLLKLLIESNDDSEHT